LIIINELANPLLALDAHLLILIDERLLELISFLKRSNH